MHHDVEVQALGAMGVKKRQRKRRRHYITGTHSSMKGGECKYRSGWELAYMQHLDADESVKLFEYELLRIPYVSNVRSGKLRNYYPDFLVEYVDGTKKLVEIKPSKRVLQANVQKKLRAAEAWCKASGVTLVVITEVDLKMLGLLR